MEKKTNVSINFYLKDCLGVEFTDCLGELTPPPKWPTLCQVGR